VSLYGQFVEQAKEVNLEHVHIEPRLIGGGVAIFDFNNDGYEDLYLTGGVRQDWVFLNDRNGSFDRLSLDELTIATRTTTTIGAVAGDINNDGLVDLYVTTDQQSPNILLLNTGQGHFLDISQSSGIIDMAWSISAVMSDFNGDGLLDIYTTNYIKTPRAILNDNDEVIGFNHECFRDFLYINNGDLTFSEMSEDYGLNLKGCGLAVAATDVNEDGFPDILVANDFGDWILPNTLYQFDRDQRIFVENASHYNLNHGFYAMGLANGDIDNNGTKDFYVSNIGQNGFFKDQGPNAPYERAEHAHQIAHENADGQNSVSWGVINSDLDNDGFQDLLIANGTIGSADFLEVSDKDPNAIYMNDGGNGFFASTNFFDVDSIQRSRGVVTFDYDLDGDLDVLFTNVVTLNPSQGNVHFYRNDLSKGNFLELRLKDDKGSSNQFGSTVFLYDGGQLIGSKELMVAGTHVSSSSDRLHFGLGDLDGIDSLRVRWLGGEYQTFKEIPTNQRLELVKGNTDFSILGCTQSTASNFNPEANLDDGSCNVVTRLMPDEYLQVKVYPNPTSSRVSIDIPNQWEEPGHLTITNMAGSIILNQYIDQGHNELQLPKEPGLYIMRINKGDDLYLIKKILVNSN
jgi:hypothetical protein